jgi:hypothetical protein
MNFLIVSAFGLFFRPPWNETTARSARSLGIPSTVYSRIKQSENRLIKYRDQPTPREVVNTQVIADTKAD